MEAINYLLGLIIIFSGLIIGTVLTLIAKEELKPGKKYLLILQRVLLLLIIIITVYFSPYLALKVVLAGILVYLFIFKFSFNDILIYGLFGFIYFMFTDNLNILLLLSSLMFLYGLPIGSLMTYEIRKQDYKSIMRNIVYRYIWIIITGLILFLVI